MPPQLELESTLVDVDSASRFFFTVVVLVNERDDVIAVADVEDCADADEAVAANDKHAAATATIAVRDLPNFIINTALYHVKLTRIRGTSGAIRGIPEDTPNTLRHDTKNPPVGDIPCIAE